MSILQYIFQIWTRITWCLLFGHMYIKELETKDHEYTVIEYCSNCGKEKL